jgi:ABC-2 type transport system permease protein
MLSLGLLVAALARNGRVAAAAGAMLFLPLMFFAGLWTPQATDVRRGCAASATTRPWARPSPPCSTAWPASGRTTASLAVLAGYALVFGVLAWRLFRWE